MPAPAGHRAAVKKNIINSARRLFNRHGFESVSLYQIMAGAGLTHGGFYSYFKSKSDLYTAVLGCFFTDPGWKTFLDGVHVDLSSIDGEPGGASANRAFETLFKAMVSVLERSFIQTGRRRRTTAQGISAPSIGGMIVARTMADRALADELRAACTAVALNLGGWDMESKSKTRKSKRFRSRRAP